MYHHIPQGSDQERGFVALISTVIMAAILMALMYTAGAASLYARLDRMYGENQRIARSSVESCVHAALLALATTTDPLGYDSPGRVVPIGTDPSGTALFCTIAQIDGVGTTDRTIHTFAQYANAYSTAIVRITVADPAHDPGGTTPVTIRSWQTF